MNNYYEVYQKTIPPKIYRNTLDTNFIYVVVHKIKPNEYIKRVRIENSEKFLKNIEYITIDNSKKYIVNNDNQEIISIPMQDIDCYHKSNIDNHNENKTDITIRFYFKSEYLQTCQITKWVEAVRRINYAPCDCPTCSCMICERIKMKKIDYDTIDDKNSYRVEHEFDLYSLPLPSIELTIYYPIEQNNIYPNTGYGD